MNIAIGIDCSETRMGWAVVTYEDQEFLASGMENLRQRDGGWPEDQVLRAVGAIALGGHTVYVVGIEDAYFGPNPKTTMRQAATVGMATMAARVAFGSTVTYYPLPNGTWISACGIKPASNKRADKKAATRQWVETRVPQPDHILTEDECDAIGIATAAARLTVTNEVGA